VIVSSKTLADALPCGVPFIGMLFT